MPLSPGDQPRETSAAAVVGPRAHPRHFRPARDAAPVRGTRERKAVRVVEACQPLPIDT
jgi:hypothetical protein